MLARALQRRTGFALVTFVLVIFAFSWTLYATAPSGGGPLADGMRILASFGPSVAAVGIVVTRSGVAGVRRLVSPLARWRLHWSWYLGPLAGPPVAMAAGVAVHLMAGGAVGSTDHDPGLWWTIPLIFGVVLVAGGPLGEELGWRGYALPRLRAVLSPVAAALLVAVVWALWHLPRLLDPGSVQHEVPWSLFAGQIVVMSVFYTWLVNRTGSLVPALLLHASFNTTIGLLPVLP